MACGKMLQRPLDLNPGLLSVSWQAGLGGVGFKALHVPGQSRVSGGSEGQLQPPVTGCCLWRWEEVSQASDWPGGKPQSQTWWSDPLWDHHPLTSLSHSVQTCLLNLQKGVPHCLKQLIRFLESLHKQRSKATPVLRPHPRLFLPPPEASLALSLGHTSSTGLEGGSSLPARPKHLILVRTGVIKSRPSSFILYMMLLLMQPEVPFAFLGTITHTGCSDHFFITPGLRKGPEDASYIQPIREPKAAWALSQALVAVRQAWPCSQRLAEACGGGGQRRLGSQSFESETKGHSSGSSGKGGPPVHLADSNSFRGEDTCRGHNIVTFAPALGQGHPGSGASQCLGRALEHARPLSAPPKRQEEEMV